MFDISLIVHSVKSTSNQKVKIWHFKEFIEINHYYTRILTNELKQTIDFIIIVHFQLLLIRSRILLLFVKRVIRRNFTFSLWSITTENVFKKNVIKFFINTKEYRIIEKYWNFLSKNVVQRKFSYNEFFSSNRRRQKLKAFTTFIIRISTKANISKDFRFRDEYDFNIFLIKNCDAYDDIIVRRRLNSFASNFSSVINYEKSKNDQRQSKKIVASKSKNRVEHNLKKKFFWFDFIARNSFFKTWRKNFKQLFKNHSRNLDEKNNLFQFHWIVR